MRNGSFAIDSPLTTGQVAKRLGISVRSVIKLIDDGHLHGYRIPAGSKHRRVTAASLRQFLEENADWRRAIAGNYSKIDVKASSLEQFVLVYEACLRACLAAYPDRYAYGPESVPEVVARMRDRLVGAKPMPLLTGEALLMTCQCFDIKPTETEIRKFIS